MSKAAVFNLLLGPFLIGANISGLVLGSAAPIWHAIALLCGAFALFCGLLADDGLLKALNELHAHRNAAVPESTPTAKANEP